MPLLWFLCNLAACNGSHILAMVSKALQQAAQISSRQLSSSSQASLKPAWPAQRRLELTVLTRACRPSCCVGRARMAAMWSACTP